MRRVWLWHAVSSYTLSVYYWQLFVLTCQMPPTQFNDTSARPPAPPSPLLEVGRHGRPAAARRRRETGAHRGSCRCTIAGRQCQQRRRQKREQAATALAAASAARNESGFGPLELGARPPSDHGCAAEPGQTPAPAHAAHRQPGLNREAWAASKNNIC